MIKTVIRIQNDMVMVFNKRGEQIPEYQGQYDGVKDCILKDAPLDAVFAHGLTDTGGLQKTPREKW